MYSLSLQDIPDLTVNRDALGVFVVFDSAFSHRPTSTSCCQTRKKKRSKLITTGKSIHASPTISMWNATSTSRRSHVSFCINKRVTERTCSWLHDRPRVQLPKAKEENGVNCTFQIICEQPWNATRPSDRIPRDYFPAVRFRGLLRLHVHDSATQCHDGAQRLRWEVQVSDVLGRG